jgi:hypothetical protein
MPFEEAVLRLSSQPAWAVQLHNQGRIATGAFPGRMAFGSRRVGADRRERTRDQQAICERRIARGQGIEHILVGGVQVRAGGMGVCGVRPGSVVPTALATKTAD